MQLSPFGQWPMLEMEDVISNFEDGQKSQGAAFDKSCVGHFATRAAADSASGAYTAQGGVLTDGMTRTIAGYPETYRAGAWRGVMPTMTQTPNFFETTFNGSAETGVASLAIADPGVSYLLDVFGSLNLAANAGTSCEAYLRLDSISGPQVPVTRVRSGGLPDGELISLDFPAYRMGPYTGTHTLLCTVKRTAGTGNWAVNSGGNLLRANIIPV